MLPFTHQQFVFVFALYNGVIWPLQWLAQAMGVGMLVLLAWPSPLRDRMNVLALAAMWIWTGLVYHVAFFSLINPASTLFGAAFALEGLLLAEAAWHRRLVFGRAKGLRRALGWALLIYSVALYPALGLLLGERALDLPAFGLTPCPVALTTLGLLMLAGSAPVWLYVIPVAWALIGGSAAVLLHMPQDWPLLLAPLLLVVLVLRERLQRRSAASPACSVAPPPVRPEASGRPASSGERSSAGRGHRRPRWKAGRR
ncbi:MAG: DUF6064 family protein [Burkholderiales bacterium]|nr:DUF6064 family protein [Burkholderiales bacterium]